MLTRTDIRTWGMAMLLTGVIAMPAASDPLLGIRGGVNLDHDDPVLGGELLAAMGGGWWSNPNVEYTLGADVLGLNADFHYDFATSTRTSVWAGPGLAVLMADSPGGDDADVGINGVFGVAWATRSGAYPYLQTKVTFADSNMALVTAGVRF